MAQGACKLLGQAIVDIISDRSSLPFLQIQQFAQHSLLVCHASWA